MPHPIATACPATCASAASRFGAGSRPLSSSELQRSARHRVIYFAAIFGWATDLGSVHSRLQNANIEIWRRLHGCHELAVDGNSRGRVAVLYGIVSVRSILALPAGNER